MEGSGDPAIGRYRLSQKCVADLEGIADYLFDRNPHAAARVIATLREAFESIARNPNLGEQRDDLIWGLRIFSPQRPAHNYVIFYYQSPNGMEFSDVVHGARNWPNDLRRGDE